jgi:hypothetical protein
MKKIILILLIISYAFIPALAQHDHSSHQKQSSSAKADTAAKTTISEASQRQLEQLLNVYYNIKNALVTGDATTAAKNAGEFLRTVNAIDFKTLSEGNIHILAKDAGRISESRDLAKQRSYFAILSSNMAEVARSFKLSNQPVYLQYCPMKKASWLSSEKEIRNPYYGNSMLTCGEVSETFK